MSIEPTLAKIPTMTADQRKALRANAEDKLASGDPKWAVDAPRVQAALDEQGRKEGSERIEAAQSLPQTERVVFAFTALPLSPHEQRLVQVLLDHPGSTNKELSQHLGWNDNGWDLHFGTMCKDRMHLLWKAEPGTSRAGLFYSGILAIYTSGSSTFVMKDEAVEAFRQLGFRVKTQ